MYRNLLSVGGLTAISRVTGFFRDIALSAIMGVGPVADAFVVALKLPNQFRAIFGEGAFNAAYVPTYSKILSNDGPGGAKRFASQIYTLLLGSQLLLLALAYLLMPQLVSLIAPGFDADPQRFALAVNMTRVTFPYLAFVTLVTLHTATLNAHGRFAAGAFAPVLLNVFIVGFLGIAFAFPNAGIAASWGVFASGAAQLALLAAAARRSGLLERLTWPSLNDDVRRFFRALGPAILGSAGQQVLIFVDTILASYLPGAVSAMYYAERLYQLPQGVIAIAAATVLLPEMSRRLAVGDREGARSAQNRTIGITFALSAPFFVYFLAMPEALLRAAFTRGAFDEAAAASSARILAAYGLAIFPIVLIRLAGASFQARGDTKTPTLAFFAGLVVNAAMKFALVGREGAAGLAIATAAGAWVNFILLIVVGMARKWTRPDARLLENIAISILGCGALAWALPTLSEWGARVGHIIGWLSKELSTICVVALGFLAYGAVAALASLAFGNSLRRQFL